MNKRQKKQLMELGIGLITKVKPSRFNMHYWKCGTSACAAGWGPTLIKNCGYKIVKQGGGDRLGTYPEYKDYFGYEALEKYFGLSEKDCYRLFDSDFYEELVITPEMVGIRILKFASGVRV